MNGFPTPGAPKPIPDPLGIVRGKIGENDSILDAEHIFAKPKLGIFYTWLFPLIAILSLALTYIFSNFSEAFPMVGAIFACVIAFFVGGVFDLVRYTRNKSNRSK